MYVKDGIVSLRGEASSQAQKELTTEYAKDIDNVKEVKNEMTIAKTPAKPDETIGEKIDDASITAQVKSSLLSHRSTSALKTKVETTDGVVTLSGIAKNAAEKSLVTKLVTDINGVSSVVNNMTIAVPAEPRIEHRIAVGWRETRQPAAVPNQTERKIYVIHNCGSPARSVAARSGDQLHDGRVNSHPAGDCRWSWCWSTSFPGASRRDAK